MSCEGKTIYRKMTENKKIYTESDLYADWHTEIDGQDYTTYHIVKMGIRNLYEVASEIANESAIEKIKWYLDFVSNTEFSKSLAIKIVLTNELNEIQKNIDELNSELKGMTSKISELKGMTNELLENEDNTHNTDKAHERL